jgi:hypothetical protein
VLTILVLAVPVLEAPGGPGVPSWVMGLDCNCHPSVPWVQDLDTMPQGKAATPYGKAAVLQGKGSLKRPSDAEVALAQPIK